MVFLNIEVRVKRAGPSGLGDLEVTEYIARIRSRPFEREDGAPVHLATTEARFMLTNSFSVFITSNQIPLHVHAVYVFCQLHVHCIHIWREA